MTRVANCSVKYEFGPYLKDKRHIPHIEHMQNALCFVFFANEVITKIMTLETD